MDNEKERDDKKRDAKWKRRRRRKENNQLGDVVYENGNAHNVLRECLSGARVANYISGKQAK